MNNTEKQKASLFEEAFFHSTYTYIHPTAIVGSDVILGQGVKIGPNVIIVGKVTIEDCTRIYPSTIIGFPAQNLATKDSLGTIIIKKNCEIREFVTIHASKYPDGKTVIGNNCYIMNYSHVSHDCILEDNVTLINNVNLGGHTHIEKNAILMAGAATHQFCKIGTFTALAPFSAIRQDIPPFCIFDGKPANFMGLNAIGLKRAGFTQNNLLALKRVTKQFYIAKKSVEDIEQLSIDEGWGNDSHVQTFIAFIKQSSRGVSRGSLLDTRKEDASL